jgi:FKBP-type peptidyl-prolyl cis-trans isomerase FkpA
VASSKEIRDRAFALSGAILFLVTSAALTIVVIVSQVQANHQKSEAAKQAVAQSAAATKGTKLQGTKLAGFTPVSSVTSLQSTDLTVGTGATVTSVNNTITADYTGALASTGVIFQSSLDSGQPFTTKLSGVITGWQQGIIGMKVGGVRRLVIPASEAYGSAAQDGIPANSNLVFDITLHAVK